MRTGRRAPGLFRRIGLPLVVLGMLLACGALCASLAVFAVQIEHSQRQRAEDLATMVTNAADSSAEIAQLRRFIATLAIEQDIELLAVAVGEPPIIAAANRRELQGQAVAGVETLAPGAEAWAAVRAGANSWRNDRLAGWGELLVPLQLSGTRKSDGDLAYGVIILRLDRQWITGQLAGSALLLLLVQTALVVGLLAIALWLLHRLVLLPLRTVHEVLLSPSRREGGTDALARLSQDEIGRLGAALQQALGEASLMRRAVDASENVVVVTDPRRKDNPIVYVNPAFTRVTGYRSDEVVGSNPRLLQREDRDQDGVRQLRQALAEGRACAAVLRNYRHDGSMFWNQMHISPVRDAAGSIMAWIGISSDITEQRKQLESLWAAKAFIAAIIDHLPLAVFCKDADSRRFTLWNRAAERLYGFTAAQVIGKCDQDLFPPEQVAAFRAKDDTVVDSAGYCDIQEEPVTTAAGASIWLHTRKACITAADGTPTHILGISEDITSRRLDEQRLRAARSEAENLLTVLSTMLIQIDDRDRVVRYNAAAERLFSVPTRCVLGRTVGDARLGLDWSEITPLMVTTLVEQRTQELHDLRCARADGSEFYLDLYVTPAPPAADSPRPSVLILGHDVTRRRMEEAMREQSQRLESIGQLASGIAHEINTPIQFIGDNLRFLADAVTDLLGVVAPPPEGGGAPPKTASEIDLPYLSAETPRAIGQALEGVERVASIVRAMKVFAHPDQDQGKQPVDLNQAIATTLVVAHNEYKYVAEVFSDIDADLPPIPGNPGELNQVLLNLIVNAAQAIAAKNGKQAERGEITISTRRVGEFAEIRIRDSGTGILPEHRNRIFSPFFTTKPVGKGTGQGLALCHAIITRKHGGSITFETEEGQGTTFIIRLPFQSAGGPNAKNP